MILYFFSKYYFKFELKIGRQLVCPPPVHTKSLPEGEFMKTLKLMIKKGYWDIFTHTTTAKFEKEVVKYNQKHFNI